MTPAEFADLGTGELIRHKGNGQVYVITDVLIRHGEIEFYIATRTVKVVNPGEWEKEEGWQK